MAYLIERKSQTIFVTATSIIAKGKPREMIVESRPEYAVIQLAGMQEKFPVPWKKCTQRAKRRHEANLANLRLASARKQTRQRRQRKVAGCNRTLTLISASALAPLRGLVQAGNEILSAQMRVALQHLHALMTADCRNLLIRKARFNKSAHGLMT